MRLRSWNQPVAIVFAFLLGAAFVWMLLSSSPIQLFGAALPVAAQTKSNQAPAEFDLAELNSLVEQVLSVAEADLGVDNREILDRAQALGMIAAVSTTAAVALNNKYLSEEKAKAITAGAERLSQLEQKKQKLMEKRDAILAKPKPRSLTPTQSTTQKIDPISTASQENTISEIDTELEAIDQAIQQAKDSTNEARESFKDALQKIESIVQMETQMVNTIANIMKTKNDTSKNIIKNKR